MLSLRGKRLKVGLAWKLFNVSMLVLIVVGIYVGLYTLPKLRGTMWRELENKTREEVEVA